MLQVWDGQIWIQVGTNLIQYFSRMKNSLTEMFLDAVHLYKRALLTLSHFYIYRLFFWAYFFPK